VTHVRTLAADTDAGAEYRGGFGRMNNGLSAGAGTKGAGIGARAVAASVGLGRYSLPGYWGDILVGPWFGWGAEGLDRDAFEVKNKQVRPVRPHSCWKLGYLSPLSHGFVLVLDFFTL
jgi:hypothetical protein